MFGFLKNFNPTITIAYLFLTSNQLAVFSVAITPDIEARSQTNATKHVFFFFLFPYFVQHKRYELL